MIDYTDAYKYHTEKGTELGKAMLADPIHAGFFIRNGNTVDSSWRLDNILYKYYFKLRINKLVRAFK